MSNIGKCRWFQSKDGETYLSLCDAIWAHQFDFALDKVLLDGKPCKKCGHPIELIAFREKEYSMPDTITLGRAQYAAFMGTVQALINVMGRQYVDSGVKENQIHAAVNAIVEVSKALDASETKEKNMSGHDAVYIELRDAIINRAIKRKAVQRWMQEEGEKGHLHTNKEAPGWYDYEDAEKRFDVAIFAVEALEIKL